MCFILKRGCFIVERERKKDPTLRSGSPLLVARRRAAAAMNERMFVEMCTEPRSTGGGLDQSVRQGMEKFGCRKPPHRCG